MNFVAAATEVEAVKWRDIYANEIQNLVTFFPIAVLLGRVRGILRSPIIAGSTELLARGI